METSAVDLLSAGSATYNMIYGPVTVLCFEIRKLITETNKCVPTF